MSYTRGPGPLQSEHEQLKSDIGIVEDGNAAVHAIAEGQYVIWKGNLYVANVDIAIGTTLSAESNGNLTEKTKGLGEDVAKINDKVNATEGMSSILAKTATTASYVTKTLTSGRKFSDYKMLNFQAFRGNWIIGTINISAGHFSSSATTGISIVSFWNDNKIEVDAKYVSDTQVDVKHITSDTGDIYIRIVGYMEAF